MSASIKVRFRLRPTSTPDMPFTPIGSNIGLPNGLEFRLALDPVPLKNERGGFGLCGLPGCKKKPAIEVSFYRNGKLLDALAWNEVINGSQPARLSDGTLLDEQTLAQLDSDGWEMLWQFGLFPDEFF